MRPRAERPQLKRDPLDGCRDMAAIDTWLPSFDIRQRHEAQVPLPPESALRHALAVPAAPDPVVRMLFGLRGLRPAGSIEDFMVSNGFTVLERTPTAYVVGLVVRGWRASPEPWPASTLPHTLRIVADFRTEPDSEGSRLITETRVAAGGLTALLGFRLYWLVVSPFSKLIRRRWLRAAAARLPAAV